ncbi:MAG: mannosyl-glycoprotein endo-beta-N-acetylglucosamidase, partial [Solobacterium sp.]|nr:mannosyl-glycoprotein endo-beta-N-acetylglucosamidase [Solobacterium sp.]
NRGDHHYTGNAKERNNLEAQGWKYEGIAWYSSGSDGVPQYRLYNPNAVSGSHHYTASKEERAQLEAAGWKYEGIGFYTAG